MTHCLSIDQFSAYSLSRSQNSAVLGRRLASALDRCPVNCLFKVCKHYLLQSIKTESFLWQRHISIFIYVCDPFTSILMSPVPASFCVRSLWHFPTLPLLALCVFSTLRSHHMQKQNLLVYNLQACQWIRLSQNWGVYLSLSLIWFPPNFIKNGRTHLESSTLCDISSKSVTASFTLSDHIVDSSVYFKHLFLSFFQIECVVLIQWSWVNKLEIWKWCQHDTRKTFCRAGKEQSCPQNESRAKIQFRNAVDGICQYSNVDIALSSVIL